MQNPIQRYLEDAIAAEKSFETQLRGFAKEATLPAARNLFDQHAEETRQQYEDLTARLEAMGGSTSSIKSMLAHLFNSAPKMAQMGHDETERTTQDLMMAFAVENAEVAMYEALTIAAEIAGDHETAQLARRIQAQERMTAEKVWGTIAPSATESFRTERRGSSQADAADPAILRYLQDAEAAERNFEDALTSFSKGGEQGEVRSMMSTMAGKARTQHQRLRARLETLGGSRSTSKSVLAHLLAFTPLTAQAGHDDAEKSTQHLMIVYAAAASEMAMYEALAVTAIECGDRETAALARELQSEEQEDHRMAWQGLGQSARASMQSLFSHS